MEFFFMFTHHIKNCKKTKINEMNLFALLIFHCRRGCCNFRHQILLLIIIRARVVSASHKFIAQRSPQFYNKHKKISLSLLPLPPHTTNIKEQNWLDFNMPLARSYLASIHLKTITKLLYILFTVVKCDA